MLQRIYNIWWNMAQGMKSNCRQAKWFEITESETWQGLEATSDDCGRPADDPMSIWLGKYINAWKWRLLKIWKGKWKRCKAAWIELRCPETMTGGCSMQQWVADVTKIWLETTGKWPGVMTIVFLTCGWDILSSAFVSGVLVIKSVSFRLGRKKYRGQKK